MPLPHKVTHKRGGVNLKNIVAVIIILLVLLIRLLLSEERILRYRYNRSDYGKVSGVEFDSILSDKGVRGEFLIFLELEKLPGQKHILSNVYLEKGEGTTELDIILLDECGLTVVESKNYAGKIYGFEKNKNWNQYLNGNKNRFYNPIWQNKGHITSLKEFFELDEGDLVLSLIVFGNESEMRQIEVQSSNVSVIQTRDVISTIKKHRKRHEKNGRKKLSESEIEEMYTKLLPHILADETTKEAHIKYVKTKTS